MYYQYTIAGWLKNPNPEAQKHGCGKSICEPINCETVDEAKYFMLQRYPTFQTQGAIIRCLPLDLEVVWER